MTIEEQAILEAEQQAKAEAEAKDAENQNDENQNDGSVIENKIDYKAIAEQERQARERAEKAAADNAFKFREEKRKREEDESYVPPTTEETLTKADLLAMEDRLEKRFASSTIKDIAEKLSSSPEEAEAILETHRNRTFPSNLSLEQQLKECQAIVNAPSIMGQRNELARALLNKNGVSNGSTSSRPDTLPKNKEPEITPDVKLVLREQGLTFNQTSGLYEAKLSGNRIRIYNPQTKKFSVINA
jgi:membrane protein involved in colicin uptake